MRSPVAVPAVSPEDIERREPSLSRATGPRAVAPDRAGGSARANVLRAAPSSAAPGLELRAGERIAVLSDDAPADGGFARGILVKLAIVVVVVLALVGVASLLRPFVGL